MGYRHMRRARSGSCSHGSEDRKPGYRLMRRARSGSCSHGEDIVTCGVRGEGAWLMKAIPPPEPPQYCMSDTLYVPNCC